MRGRLRSTSAVVITALVVFPFAFMSGGTAGDDLGGLVRGNRPEVVNAGNLALPGGVPLAGDFTENAGQVRNAEVRYYAASGNLLIGFAESAVLLVVREATPAPRTLEGPRLAGPERDIAPDEREALIRRAARTGLTVSELVRDMLRQGLAERSVSAKAGHLKGRLRIKDHAAGSWRHQIRERNWRR